MATRLQTFLVRADNDRECVMRLPVDRYGGITLNGYKAIRRRFCDGSTDIEHGLKYAINLEAFNSGHNIAAAIEKYYQNTI
jgi:3-deoxy-D-arabino-heptulosonate 7-phosphate (DAHP) synthase